VHQATAQNLALIARHTYWWPLDADGLYRPLATLSYLFNYAILGNADHPAGYHWINILVHGTNVLLAFALARHLLKDLIPSALAAGLWSVHPVLTESVTNIIGRPDLLSALALLGGLLLYIRSADARGRRRGLLLTGLAALTLVGVFSKETGVMILP